MCWVFVFARNQLEPNKFTQSHWKTIERRQGGTCGQTVTSASLPSSLPDLGSTATLRVIMGLGRAFLAPLDCYLPRTRWMK